MHYPGMRVLLASLLATLRSAFRARSRPWISCIRDDGTTQLKSISAAIAPIDPLQTGFWTYSGRSQ